MKFNIEAEEIFQDVYEVEADSLEEAIEIVRGKFDRGEIIFDSENFMGRNFREYKDVIEEKEKEKKNDKCVHCGKELPKGASRLVTSNGVYCFDDECYKAHLEKFNKQ